MCNLSQCLNAFFLPVHLRNVCKIDHFANTNKIEFKRHLGTERVSGDSDMCETPAETMK